MVAWDRVAAAGKNGYKSTIKMPVITNDVTLNAGDAVVLYLQPVEKEQKDAINKNQVVARESKKARTS